MECPICLEPINASTQNVRLACNHAFHHECIIEHCNEQRSNKYPENCPICRCPITDDITRIIGEHATVYVSRDFRVSSDGGLTWTAHTYDDPRLILSDYFKDDELTLRFERYSITRQRCLWYTMSDDMASRDGAIMACTYFPGSNEDISHFKRILDTTGYRLKVAFGKSVMPLHFWFSFLWSYKRAIV